MECVHQGRQRSHHVSFLRGAQQGKRLSLRCPVHFVTLLVICALVRLASAADAPSAGLEAPDVPGPAPVTSSSSFAGVVSSCSLQPQVAQAGIRLPESFLISNYTWRFVGQNLFEANDTFQNVVRDAFSQVVPASSNLVLEYSFRPGVEARIIGPDGDSGLAYAPTPGEVPADFGRKLLQSVKPFSKETFDNRYTAYMSIDVEILAMGNINSSIVQILEPAQLNGYLAVLMSQKGIGVTPLPINISASYTMLPVIELLPVHPTYVLGTVLQISGSDFFPVNTQVQGMLLLALNSVFGSQTSYLYNRVQEVWQDSACGKVRISVFSYTNQQLGSMNQIAGADVPALMSQVAQAAGANFSVVIDNSTAFGTQIEELMGNTSFALDTEPKPGDFTVPTSKSSKLSDGAIAGIVVGGVAALVISAAVCVVLSVLRRRKKFRVVEKGHPVTASPAFADKLAPLRGSSGSPDSSSGLTGGKGSTAGSSSTTSEGNKPRSPAAQHPLSEVWHIDPSELALCQLPDGRDWLLGVGSFGHVYRGLRGGVQDVAIKQLIKPGNMHLRMFEKEVALLRHLNFDRNLVQFYGACIAENNLMLVLEYMDGGDLKDALGDDHAGEFGWYNKGSRVLMDVARGLHFLHSNKVAHRDLKTKNIMLSKTGEAKVADVGLAKLVGSQLLSTQLDTAGTFAYAAPELLLGEPCDQSADIYSFGVIMWEVVTHEIPVRGALRGVNVPSEAPQEVADLIEACLQRLPKARPTAKQLFDRLAEILARPGATLQPVLESVETMKTDTTTTASQLLSTGMAGSLLSLQSASQLNSANASRLMSDETPGISTGESAGGGSPMVTAEERAAASRGGLHSA